MQTVGSISLCWIGDLPEKQRRDLRRGTFILSRFSHPPQSPPEVFLLGSAITSSGRSSRTLRSRTVDTVLKTSYRTKTTIRQFCLRSLAHSTGTPSSLVW